MQAGESRYFTGNPCPHGHVAERYVKTWQCVECVRGASKEWREANLAKSDEINRQWRKRNPGKVKIWKSESQKRNRAAANVRNKRYADKNRESENARTAAWAKANPAKVLAKRMRYHAAKLNRTPVWADQAAILQVYERAFVLRGEGRDVHVDHILPIQGKLVSGLHVHTNLQIIDAHANRVKSNHF